MDKRYDRNRFDFRCGPFLLGVFLVVLPVSARTEIVADGGAPANQQPTVLTVGNDVPLVNIQTPSAAGVSRNTYSQFDVNGNGAILNNSRTDAQTQLGGWVQGNPWLATGSARVILNEVNSSNPSSLIGYVEVAGSQAQVVIANPAGISCDGCGFINANRATLSTGTPILNGGNLEGYRVEGGAVQINGAGLDAGSAGYTDLIGRAVQVNAGVWAQRLNLVAGAGEVNAAASAIAAGTGNGPAPTVAIDVAQLGGMYANSIQLIGTEAGVGVRNAGSIGAAAGQVTITADGRLENTGVLSAGQVQVSADALNNSSTGVLSAQQLAVQATTTLDNQGVIDGGTSRLDAGTLNNTGSGRIYGDQLSLQTQTLNNTGNGTQAPVIAARERLDIGVSTINNREHASLYSAGDLAIGGTLDVQNHAAGQADTLNNASATLEAQGNLDLAVRTVNNTNEHLVTAEVQVSSERIHEYGGEGSPNRYSPDEVSFIRRDRARDLRTPDGSYRVWQEYDYQRTVTETQVVETDPAQILAGGDISLNTGAINNNNSLILAGGDLTGTTDTINNQQHPASRVIADNGSVTRYRRVEEDDAGGTKSHWEQRDSTAGYTPADKQTFPDGLGLARSAGGQTPPDTGIQLPDNSLYNLNPDSPNGYLVETDPRFANYRSWLSSDYMLQQLALDPATTQMRLGDGFYEQQLIREQMAQLTGRRFLDGYSDDEAQYAALMNAGVTFAQVHELRPGVALSAEQIAQLTSDIVWLVEQDITLDDGSTKKVLVPTLYVLVREDGLDDSGALISADNIQLDMNASLNNSGTIAGRRVTALTAENIDNVRGTLQGQDVQLSARQDLNNIGGSIRAQDSLSIDAGRDINVVSTTTTNSNAQGTRTNIDRVAGLYVNAGSLMATAGRDINLTGAAIINNTLTLDAERLGNTALTAGNDFILNSVQENEQMEVVWNPGTYRRDANTTQTGTLIQTAGDLQVQAGRDLTGTAATIASTQGAVHLAATRDLHIRAGVNDTHIEGRGRTNRSQTDITRHTIAGVSAGDDVTLGAGGDMTLHGTALQARGDVKLGAAGDTVVTAVVDTEYHYDKEKQKRSYGRSESTLDETLISQVSGGTISAGGNLLINAHKNDQGDVITEHSGDVTLTGTTLQSQGDIAIATDGDVAISAIQYNTLDFHQTQNSGVGGLSKADQGNASLQTGLHNAELASGSNTHILAGNNLSLIAANVTASGDINLEAVDQLLIGAGQILTSTEQWKNNSSAFSSGHVYEMSEHREGETVSAAQASSIAAGGSVTARAGTGRIVGSDIHGAEGVDLQADAGDFDIESAQTTRTSYTHDKEVTVSLGDSSIEGAVNPALLVQVNDGRATVHLADARYAESDTQNTSTQMRGSRISSNADINIAASAGAVAIIGSELAADADGDGSGDIGLSAAQQIDIREATDTASTQSHTTTGDAELSLVVQNQAVEVVKAYQNLEDAKEQLEESKRQYKDYERNLDQLENSLRQLEQDVANNTPGANYADVVELRALVAEVKDDKEWYVAGIALAALNLTSATTALVQQTATAAASTATYGFNAGLQLDIDASKTSSEYQSTTAVASTLSGQNIRINTGNGNTQNTQTNIQGSHLQASNNIAITTGDLNITASKNTAQSGTETEHGHVTAQMTVYGAAGGASVNASFDRSKNSARETTYNNSFLLADSIDITTSGDTTLRGATVRAESELNADIQGNLIVESVQDRSSSRNTSEGISGGMSLGGAGANKDTLQGTSDIGALSGVNAGANSGNGMSNSRQTVLTSLTSGGTANINVQNHTQITGALIGTTDENGNDLNQLNLSTNTINFTDLRDNAISSQTGAGLSTNVGIGPEKSDPAQQTTAETSNGTELRPGTSNLTYTNSQQNRASNTLATLGHGNITVSGTVLEQNGELTEAGLAVDTVLAGINRDTTNTTKDLWNSDYSQELDVTLDHRLLTEDGRNEIKQNAEMFGNNIQVVAQMVPSANENNAVLAAVGKVIDALSYATVGILPSDRFNGGLLANIPVLLGDNDISHKVIQIATADSPYVLANPDLFIPLTESEYYLSASAENQAAMREQGLYVTRYPITIDQANATYQNFTNGMFNSEGDAIKNGLDQTGSPIFTLNYNPTHGFLGDLMESAVDKNGGTSGIAEQTGNFIFEVTNARAMTGSNFAAHSQGNLLYQSGIEYQNANGGFQDKSYFVDPTRPSEKEKNAGIPTYSSFGSPVNTMDMMETVQGKDGEQFVYSGAYTKEGDAVGEVIGGNKGQNEQMDAAGRVQGSVNLRKLLSDDSPHSTYLCENHEGAKQTCGYKR